MLLLRTTTLLFPFLMVSFDPLPQSSGGAVAPTYAGKISKQRSESTSGSAAAIQAAAAVLMSHMSVAHPKPKIPKP